MRTIWQGSGFWVAAFVMQRAFVKILKAPPPAALEQDKTQATDE
jgi:hypothetical protein